MRRVKEPDKIFTSDLKKIQSVISETLGEIAAIVGSTLGPGGRVVAIESMLPDVPHTVTKDGVTVFRNLGAQNALKQLVIEITREAAIKTVSEVGDGTSGTTILAAAFTQNLFEFCSKNPRFSPQKTVRAMNKLLNDEMLPYLEKHTIKMSKKKQNIQLLSQVANISVNGDEDMAKAVISSFEITGFSQGSHITIQQLSGPSNKYDVTLIEGFPISMGYENSIGKFHQAFINDKAKLRCVLEQPLFILFDGRINDLIQLQRVLEGIGQQYTEGRSDYKNVVVVAHDFSDQVLTALSYNFNDPNTINVVPFKTPVIGQINSETNFLLDLSAFTGAKIFDMNHSLQNAQGDEFGQNMERMEIYRFRATVVGEPDPTLVEIRAEEIQEQLKNPASKIEKILLEERLGKLTSGIAELKVYGGSVSELKEKADRAEDAVLAVRSTIADGCLPGGCRALLNLAIRMSEKEDIVAKQVVVKSLFAPFYKLLENAGYDQEEIGETIKKMIEDESLVLDVEKGIFGKAEELGIFDAMQAVRQSLINSISIASTLGTCGGIVVQPRDKELELQDSRDLANFERTLENAGNFKNESNDRI